MAILELQGYIFFGTANRIFEQIKGRLQSPQAAKLQVVLLDSAR